MTTVRTRFAPSPTGYMHIGGMRTALFNWLWAKANGGQFILRIDDTDQKRHVESALEPIFQAFRWLDMDWDEGPEAGGEFGPYFQSQRGDLYKAAVEKLLADGHAFRDYNTPEQNAEDRELADKEKRPRLNIRRSLELTDAEREQYEAEGRNYVIRLLVPRDEEISVDDLVRGHVEWDLSVMSDPAIARSDGSPLYNLATVVDDAQMKISHVIRAEEHLSNTPAQLLIYKALGETPPTFAHIPFVTAPGTSKKLSKRDIGKYRNNPSFKKLFEAGDRVFPQLNLGDINDDVLNPVMVQFYEQIGYLPAGLLNALAQLGWSFDDKTEILSREFLLENFTLKKVIKAPAGFDPDKLNSYQAHWMQELPREEKIAGCVPYLQQAGLLTESQTDTDREWVGKVIDILGERLVLFSDILTADDFFTADEDLTFDEKSFKKRIQKPDDAVPLLTEFREELAKADQFDAESLDKLLHDFCEQKDVKIGQIIHAIRIASTGKPSGPGMFDCLAILGKDRVLARIDRALAKANS